MFQHRYALFIAGMICCVCFESLCAQRISSPDFFNLPNDVTIDFESIDGMIGVPPVGFLLMNQYLGVTFRSETEPGTQQNTDANDKSGRFGSPCVFLPALQGGGVPTSGVRYIAGETFVIFNVSDIRIDFSCPVQAFGLYVIDNDFEEARISAFDSNGKLIESIVVPEVGPNGVAYHGISAPGISYAIIDGNNGQQLDSTFFDDFSYRPSNQSLNTNSSDESFGLDVSGALTQQILAVNSSPPVLGIIPINRHSDFHEVTTFVCDAGPGALVPPTIGGIGDSRISELLDGVTTDLTNEAETDINNIYIFAEQARMRYAPVIEVDWRSDVDDVGITYGGNTQPAGGVILGGSIITSHLLHFDVLEDQSAALSGSATFDSEIIGVILSTDKLNAADSVVGVEGVSYPTASDRAWEIGGTSGTFTISLDGKTITVAGIVDDFLNQMRIITLASPEDPLNEPYLSANEFIDGADEVTLDNCSSAWYKFTFELPGNFTNASLTGIANVDDVAVAWLNGNRISAEVDINDLGVDRVDAAGLPLLSWPTQDSFSNCDETNFVAGTNELVFGVIGDLSPFDPTGLEFEATVSFDLLASLDSINVLRGVVVAGDLAEVQESDDIYLRLNPGFIINSLEAPAWVEFSGTAPNSNVVEVESQAGTPGLTYTVEAWNWVLRDYEEIGTQSEQFNIDQIVSLPMVADHVNSDGSVQTRVGWRQTGFTINFPWEVRIDQVDWN